MKKAKPPFSLLLAVLMMLSLQPAVFAAAKDTGFTDVNVDAWYADAVIYCVEHNIMSGTGETQFSPDTPMSRAMLATVLYRMAGNPEITGTSGFSDVQRGIWYSDAVTWASQNGIVSGYGSGLFGINDPVTREQTATILWRYSGNPTAGNMASPFLDAADISSYAMEAVAWAKEFGIVGGKPGNCFDPKGNATRAEVVTILRNFSSLEREPEPKPAPTPEPTTSDGMKNITITVGNTVYTAKLYDNDTANAFQAMLPMTLSMSELNGNEKYCYLLDKLPTNTQKVGSINAGDLMLYGSDCLVIFYEGFTTTYSYTKLGYIENATGLVEELGHGNIQVAFV